MTTTLGVEEEFVLLDPSTLTPVPAAAQLLELVATGPRLPGSVTAEFFASQIEYATPVCETAQQAQDALVFFRQVLRRSANQLGVVAAGVGTPFRPDPQAQLSPGPRYARIASAFGEVAREHQINGLHIHVGVPARDAAVTAVNEMRPWLPVLLALSVNSPFWDGRDTGYSSWRTIHSRRWTTTGIPPSFLDACDYDRRTAALSGIGGTEDIRTLNWVARPSSRYPTVEIRACDAQLDPDVSVALACLVRGLVTSGQAASALSVAPAHEVLDAAFWHAAKNGLSGTLVDPADGALRPAGEIVESVIDAAMPGLNAHGDVKRVEETVSRILSNGTGAMRQRNAFAAGEPDVARLFAAER